MFRILLVTLVVWNALGDGKYLYQNFNMLVKNLEFLFLCFFIQFLTALYFYLHEEKDILVSSHF